MFLLLYAILSYYSRLATDDYYFIWDLQRIGIWQSLYEHYIEWSGRFSAGFVADVFYKNFGHNQKYYNLYPLISLFLLASGIYSALINITSYFNIVISKFYIIYSTTLFIALFFFLSFDIGESWFWYCSLCTYLWSIIVFIWGIALILSRRSHFIIYPLIFICFLYIGGASEFNSAIFSLLFLAVFAFQWKKRRNISTLFSNSVFRKLLMAFITLEISFFILLIAPGNYARDLLFPHHQFFFSFFLVTKSIVKFLVLYLPFKIPYIIAFSFPFCIIGHEISGRRSINFSFKAFKQITYGLIAVLLIFWFLVAYVMVEAGPPRVLILVSFLLTIYFIGSFFFLGYANKVNQKQYRIIKLSSIIIGFAVMFFHLYDQYSIAKSYSIANDERIAFITKLNETVTKDTLVSLKPLPKSGMLYSSEISSDTTHFTNMELRIGYNLKYHVISEKK